MSDAESELAFDAPDWDESSDADSELAFDAPVWDSDSDSDGGLEKSCAKPNQKSKRSFEEEFQLMRDVDYRNSTDKGFAASCDELFAKLCAGSDE